MNPLSSASANPHNLSHKEREASFEAAYQCLVNKIQTRGDLPHISIQKQLELLKQLSRFEFGRFLIERGGLNGYWTHYVVTHPSKGRLTQLNIHGEVFDPLESFLLNLAPTCLATQERFSIFKEQIQQRLTEGCTLASVPSGLMADFIDLDYSALNTFSLCGIDLDQEALSGAHSYAKEKGLSAHCRFSLNDAWQLNINQEFDLLASNGLAIYEPNHEKVVALYRQFYTALKPHGVLITSFLTPPPAPGNSTQWRLDRVNLEDASMQKILFVDILDAKWQVFRTEETVRSQLAQAGFHTIEIIYDQAHIFPTVIARK